MATGKHVVVIGGGDTGSDCVGTSNRHGAASVSQLELMPKPPLVRMPENPWPAWPLVLRTSSSQEEGCARDFSVMTKGFVADASGKRVAKIAAVRAELVGGALREIPGSEFDIPCDRRAARHGLHRSRAHRHRRAAGSRARRARQRRHRSRRSHRGSEGLRRRRRVPRTVARRLGHRRRPSRGRPVSMFICRRRRFALPVEDEHLARGRRRGRASLRLPPEEGRSATSRSS